MRDRRTALTGRGGRVAVAVALATVTATACTATTPGAAATPVAPAHSGRPASTAHRTATAVTPSATAVTPSSAAVTPSPAAVDPSPSVTSAVTSPRPVVVLDPGHSPTITAVDPRTGLTVSDYANEPEMRDVFAVALIVRRRLVAAGYRVVMTKHRVDSRVSLAQRAAIANRVHAALALSIHDQAGSNGGIGFDQGNNIVYDQSVGTYRATASGHRVYFADRRVARVSHRYGRIFRTQRARVQHTTVRLQDDVGYDLGSRGLAAGDIWMVQLLSRVPWIYNEAGGNSAGRTGLDRRDRRRYAAGLVAAVEACVPIRH